MKTFKQSLQDDSFVITAELLLRGGDGPQEILQQAEHFKDRVSAIQVSENPFQPDQVSALAAAAMLVRHGVDAIPALNGRDSNRIALMSDLLGLRALGISSIVVSEGNDFLHQDNPARLVQDVDGLELISMAESLNEVDSISPEEELLIGMQTPIDPQKNDAILACLAAGAAAGARFLQIQPCFDMALLRAFMQQLVEAQLTWRFAVMASLAPLPSVEAARRLIKQRPGCLIPASILSRLESSSDPGMVGISICSELMHEARTIPGVAGVHLITMDSPQDMVDTIRESNS
jgi:methylenetetrahydrofolate reductase (NADPH)